MHQLKTFLPVIVAVALSSCSTLQNFGASDIAPQRLNMSGTYDWIDAFGSNTACIVHVYWQDESWRGWIRNNLESVEQCPWHGYELPIMRMRGDRVRMAIECPRSGCPSGTQRGTAYLIDVVPGVMMTGRAISSNVGVRWYNIRLVHKGGP